MNIIACIKAVPGFIKNPTVPGSHDQIKYDAGSIVINESDDYALEASVKLAKKTGGKTTVLTCGPLTSQKVLQTGLGKDADSAIRINGEFSDPARIAEALAAAIGKQEYDLVVTGVESSDNMAAQVGVAVAEHLQLPFAYAVLQMEAGATAGTVRVTKELGFGKKQVEEISLPAVICYQTGTEPPSFVPVRKMMMAQKRPSKTVNTSDLPLTIKDAPVRILEVFTPADLSVVEMLPGPAPEQAAAAMQKIREVL